VVSGNDPVPGDRAQVVITDVSNGTNVYNESYSPVADAHDYPVNPGTYNVGVYWNNGNSASIFDGVIAPRSNIGAPEGNYLRHNTSKTYPPNAPPNAASNPHPHHLAH
jgi:hypothetical protein